MPQDTSPFARPYVVSWNLTYRCNLACEHCYLDAGGTPQVDTDSFADRSELDTEGCFRVIDEIAAFAPECLTILTGGEPLLRRDILEIVRRARRSAACGSSSAPTACASPRTWRSAWRRPACAACRCRSMRSIPIATTASGRCAAPGGTRSRARRSCTGRGLPFIVQTTVGSHNLGELEAIADFAHDRLARQGLEPLLPGADGARAVRVGHHPRAVRRGARLAPPDPADVRPPDAREREVRAALHQDRPAAAERSPASRAASRRTYSGRGRRLPGGHALHGDPAERRRHALPLPPGLRGNASQLESRGPVDVLGAVHRHPPPHLARRALRRVRDERPLRRLPRPGLRHDRRPDGRGSALHPHARHVRRISPCSPARPRRPPRAGRGPRAIEYGRRSPPRPSPGTTRPPRA